MITVPLRVLLCNSLKVFINLLNMSSGETDTTAPYREKRFLIVSEQRVEGCADTDGRS